jgi:hypothetical protein
MELADTTTLLGYALGTALFLALRGRGFWPAYATSLVTAALAVVLIEIVAVEASLRVAGIIILPLLLFAAIRLSGLLVILPALHGALLGLARRRRSFTGPLP